MALNSKIVDRALSPAVFDTAVRDLGVSLSGRRLQIQSEDEISVIMDYALHEVGTPGARVIDQYRQRPGGKNPLERELLQAAAASAVGVYRVQSVDPRACQLTLRQLAPVQREVTVIDISFSQSPIHGAVFFTRLLELSEFNMTGGAALFFTAALEAQVMQAWSQTEPGGRYRQVFELHRRSGVPLNYASVAAGRQRGVG